MAKKNEPELMKIDPPPGEPPPARADGLPPPGEPPPAPSPPAVLPDTWELFEAASTLEELQAIVKQAIEPVWLRATPSDRAVFSARLEALVRAKGWAPPEPEAVEAKPAAAIVEAGPRRLTTAAMVSRHGARCLLPIGTLETDLVGVHPSDVAHLVKRADMWG